MTVDPSSLAGVRASQARIQAILSRIETLSQGVSGTDNTDGVFGKILSEQQAPQGNDSLNETPAPGELDSLIQSQSDQAQVDPNLVKAVIRNESNFNPKAVSSVGAQGLMQLMPSTAQGLGVTNSFDPSQNIAGGAKYLKNLLNRYDQSVPKALAAYNAGPGAVDKHNGIPPYQETQQYVNKVMKSYQVYSNQ